ncbi:MAG TPA: TIR domain-containing protein [Pyrinomonadaceae bacterium]|jgi:serine/threonine protein kinase
MNVCPTCQRTHADDIAFCPHDGTRLQQTADVLPAGHRFNDQYEIEMLVAETPNGTVYRVFDIKLGCRVALKIFNPDVWREVEGERQRFRLKLRDASGFQHPNAARIHQVTDHFMVMEWVEGQTLDEAMRQRGRFTPREALKLLKPVAHVLDAARERGLGCEFLTPADVMLKRAEDNSTSVTLLPSIFTRRFAGSDTGRRSNPPDSKTEAAPVWPYVAPELRAGAASPEDEARAQVYSLGVIAYELLCGRKPFAAQTAGENAERETTASSPRPLTELAPGVPPAVARAVARALAETFVNRPATARAFVFELQVGINSRLKGYSQLQVTESAFEDITGEASSGNRQGADIQTESSENYFPGADVTASRSVEEAVEDAVGEKPLHLDENVQFTVYQPEAIAPTRWYTLLAFAHLSKRRADAPPDEPEPLAEVRRIAERVLADQPAEYDASKQNSLHAVPRAGEITFVPEMEGCEFNPPRQSFLWQKSVHKVEFELRATQSLEGRVARGRMTVFLGSLILADVPLVVRVDSTTTTARESSQRDVPPPVAQSAAPYRKIFPSYSHKDREVVEQIEQHVHALGDKYLRDVSELRAGQDWQRWMRDAIREADVFQLFWSHNSMRSGYVREEWEYALSLGRANFVRPTYWEFPLPESPTENLPPAELRRLHFQYLQASNIAQHPAHVEDDTPDAEEQQEFDAPPAAEQGQERAAPSAAAPSRAGREVWCPTCGAPGSDAHVFCKGCGTRLDTRTHTPVQAATSAAQPTGDAFEVFRQKQESASEHYSTSPLQPMPVSSAAAPSPAAAAASSSSDQSGRAMLWIGLVLCLCLLVALAFGLFLLLYLL